jgi:hypothetical protein
MIKTHEKNPHVIMPSPSYGDMRQSFDIRQLDGEFFRVYPQTANDVFTLQMLQHRVDKFAPSHGCGIILTAAACERYFSN